MAHNLANPDSVMKTPYNPKSRAPWPFFKELSSLGNQDVSPTAPPAAAVRRNHACVCAGPTPDAGTRKSLLSSSDYRKGFLTLGTATGKSKSPSRFMRPRSPAIHWSRFQPNSSLSAHPSSKDPQAAARPLGTG